MFFMSGTPYDPDEPGAKEAWAAEVKQKQLDIVARHRAHRAAFIEFFETIPLDQLLALKRHLKSTVDQSDMNGVSWLVGRMDAALTHRFHVCHHCGVDHDDLAIEEFLTVHDGLDDDPGGHP